MLPAQPPNSRRSVGTRNETFSMCSWLAMIWSAKRPWKVAMLSKASDPQIRAAMRSPGGAARGRTGSGVEDLDGVADHGRCAGTERDLQRRLAARGQHVRGSEILRRQGAACDEAAVGVGEGEVDRRDGEHQSAAALQVDRQDEVVLARRVVRHR